MSYPPPLNRQQIGIPQLPPRIPPPQYGGFAPGVPPGTPMIPVHMGVVTPTPTVLVPTTVTITQKPMIPKKDPGGIRAKDTEDGGGPTTTVFVGNISEKASDMLVRQLLAKCGIVLSWKRVQGASGKLQAFGFCEYKEPESTLRALRLLHELLLGDKKLLVKVDAKTKAQLDEWKAKKRSANGGASGDSKNGDEDDEEVLDEETLRRDQAVKGVIDVLIREYSSELNAPSQDPDSQPRNKKRKEKKEEEDINAMEMEDDKRDLISREISKFRDTHKKLEEEKGKKEKERLELERERRERDKERERERERRDREKEKERERERDKERERDRDRERERERDRERERTKERERERERSRDASEDRSRSRERTREDKKRDREEDEEDVYERRRLERRLRDKEAAYQERLKNWEIRERKKSRDYSKETEREDERRREMMKEAKRLKEFLEDYDDDRDDPKYYSALQKRLRDREKETELDERDRKREKEELEEIRQRLLAEGHPDPDAELLRMEEEAERRRQPPLKLEPEVEVNQEKAHRDRDRDRDREKRGSGRPVEPAPRGPPPQHSDDDVEEGEDDDYHDGEDSQEAKPQLKPIMRPITTAPSVSSASGNVTPNTPGNESPCGIIIPGESTPEVQPPEEHRPKIGLSLKLGATNSPSQLNAGKRKKLATVESVFNKFDDEEADEQPRKRKLVPLDYGDDDKSLGLDGAEISGAKGSINTEEKRKHIKSLIEKIPTGRPELFSYPLDWAMVDSTLMDRRIRPWINKKIIEYIGEEEPTLVDFVCSKVMAHSTPQGILDDVAMVLDEEAEVFIVKMWRLLIYETEAKKIGLVK
ncbi:RNA-binding protein 25 isoform X3 [Amphiprion ocellaris]|uniref:RNA-binding protein 25 isoform X3 n=1 Tax=Amphiprion ocellaris TaxID=80972 RepID=UPI002410FE88|nr:RNA-binding protein 25 isoform X3 [Amphiprion ocellaris]